MRLLIRIIESRGASQHWFDGSVATIGRGTDNAIQIADQNLPLLHSKLSETAGKLTLDAVGGQTFELNGTETKKASLDTGDVVTIAGHTIKVAETEDGADFVVDVDIEADNIQPFKDRYTTRVKEVGLPQRSFSWVLFLVFISIGLVIPAAGLFIGMDKLRESPLPDDGLWLTGELHQTHAFMGDDCSYCHTEAFTQTRDEDCLYCHLSVNHHFDTETLGRDYIVGDSCGDCHKEHSDVDSITRTDQDVCTVCHADMAAAGFDETLRPASDFLHDHPTFKVTMKNLDEATGEWQSSRVDLWDEDLLENSNLIFPHDIHLSDEGIDSADGRIEMKCSDCHEPEKGGLRMKPVTMEQHCADCHQLTFDPSTPDRVVPHGSPPDLMRTLREYYAYQFLTEGQSKQKPKKTAQSGASLELLTARTSRRPGKKTRTTSISDLIVEQRIDKTATPTQRARVFIEARVADAAENLFEKQTCTICHDISKSGDDEVPWKVKPVYLNTIWMPLSEFSHSSHKNMQCDGCHDAELSDVATDVIMPDIGGCRTCHGGEDATNLLQSTCIACHQFHLESQKPMGELIEISAGISAETSAMEGKDET